MKLWTLATALGSALLFAAPASALDLTKKRQNLPDLVLGNEEGNDFVVENKDIELEAGKAYRLRIVAKGRQEYKFYAPEFFRNIWFNQIVIEHKEIHGGGPPDHLEFDDPGEIAIEFVAIRPGEYKWYSQGLEAKGLTGTISVK
ncbi:hypothetical protein [Methylobacterium gnaphalii]|uniref:Copper-binding protein n=1 Tax=Methylobacterium gnaphalii TaxID=1010610 RepID=A0A512JFA6_9HYPH|nr:hypothetical protein [Methylobacterium gnaphalii]GEP08624.1 hypothetical protein MGN01_04690 [Methylobacterium gnaphalii]GJD71223.1 hypothetical protein MMMDOFMJ_4177 [Methylobacterium gnaphalii]GLS50841.1 hypothetical protein GCM10007885_36950 [Methylobacterium gnaphalii]